MRLSNICSKILCFISSAKIPKMIIKIWNIFAFQRRLCSLRPSPGCDISSGKKKCLPVVPLILLLLFINIFLSFMARTWWRKPPAASQWSLCWTVWMRLQMTRTETPSPGFHSAFLITARWETKDLSSIPKSSQVRLAKTLVFQMIVSCTKDEGCQSESLDYSHHYSVLSRRETNTTATIIELTELGPKLALEVHSIES